jgi:hypothetical protein
MLQPAWRAGPVLAQWAGASLEPEAIRWQAQREGMMVPLWKKIGLSVISLFAGSILGAAIMVLQMLISDPPPASRMGESLLAFASLAPLFLLLSLVGWVGAIPAVILIKGFCRWRYWVYLALGTAIGPVFWLGFRMLTEKGAARFDFFAMPYQVTTVSFLIALIYILLFQRAQERAARLASGA